MAFASFLVAGLERLRKEDAEAIEIMEKYEEEQKWFDVLGVWGCDGLQSGCDGLQSLGLRGPNGFGSQVGGPETRRWGRQKLTRRDFCSCACCRPWFVDFLLGHAPACLLVCWGMPQLVCLFACLLINKRFLPKRNRETSGPLAYNRRYG